MYNISLSDRLDPEDMQFSPIYLVGGTVRDILSDRPPKDLDLVCRKAREFALNIARKKKAAFVPMEKKPGEPCYRVVDRKDREYFIDIAEMRGETIYEDLKQRDFTINAIAVEVHEDGSPGVIIDPLHGVQDLEQKVIRMTSSKSFVSDPIRVLRAIRFAAMPGFTVEDSTWDEMRNTSPAIRDVSAERIMAELFFILKNPRSSLFFRQMDSLGVLEVIFPEIRAMKACDQNGYHHQNVWDHSLLVMENTEHIINSLSEYFTDAVSQIEEYLSSNNRLELLKLAALLHDAGKPSTRGMEPATGRITFYRHDEEGSKLMEQIAGSLKMSGLDRSFLVLMVAEHLHILSLASRRIKAVTKIKWFRKMGDAAVPAIILSMADVMSILGPDATEEYREHHIRWSKESVTDYYRRIKQKIESPSLITGNDLIAIGMKPGPEIGQILLRIRSGQDAGEINSREEALSFAKLLLTA